MRIIAGDFRGRPLTPIGKGDQAAHLRPTSDRVRESLFSALASRDVIEGAQVLDVFAGSGALGLEALSRGAAHVTFVDDGRIAQRLISKNIDLLQVAARARLIKRDVCKLEPTDDTPFDLIFLDPPYGKSMGQKAIEHLAQHGWIAPGAFIVWEESTSMAPPPGFSLLDQRKYGDTHVTFLEADDS